MDSLQYIDNLKNNLTEYFDIFNDFEIYGTTFPLYAKCLLRNERYIGNKKLVTDAYENQEHIFVQFKNENVEEKDIENFARLLKSIVIEIVIPNEEHMSTTINGIYITNNIFTPDALKYGTKFKYHKNFAFGLKGWCDIGIILVELGNKNLYTNKTGKMVKPLYQSILK